MSQLECCFLTFNCNSTPIDSTYVAQGLSHILASHDTRPDLIFITLQELAAIPDALLGGFMVAPYLDKVKSAVDAIVPRTPHPSPSRYEHVETSIMNFVVGMLFALPTVAPNISALETAQARVGEQSYGNKAAVAIRFKFGLAGGPPTTVTFVGAHFQHAENKCEQRNRDWRTLNECLVFRDTRNPLAHGTTEEQPLLQNQSEGQSPSTNLFSPGSHIFFGGDLNYRAAEQAPKAEDQFPLQTAPLSDPLHYTHLLAHDQLDRERKAGRTLHQMTESAITFPPTYKYSNDAMAAANILAESSATPQAASEEPQEWLWSRKRWPAWTDRVLYLDLPKSLSAFTPEVKEYTSLPIQPTSDHRPVVLLFTLPIPDRPLTTQELSAWPTPPFRHKSSRIPTTIRDPANRAVEIGIGLQAWVALTWQGRFVGASALCAGLALWYYSSAAK